MLFNRFPKKYVQKKRSVITNITHFIAVNIDFEQQVLRHIDNTTSPYATMRLETIPKESFGMYVSVEEDVEYVKGHPKYLHENELIEKVKQNLDVQQFIKTSVAKYEKNNNIKAEYNVDYYTYPGEVRKIETEIITEMVPIF